MLTEFLQACGATGGLRLSAQRPGEAAGLHRDLPQPFAVLGRDPRCDLPLEDPEVSRRHAYFQMLAGRVFWIDLQSRTGTHCQGAPQGSGWLDYEQGLSIGPFLIRLASSSTNGRPATARELNRLASEFLAAHPLAEVTLEFANRSAKASVWPMTPMLVLVGKSPSCRVHLVGRNISYFHCSLVRTPAGVWVVDLFGRGGIRVNDALVRCARLEEGDRLQVGKFLIRPHYESRPGGADGPERPARAEPPAREVSAEKAGPAAASFPPPSRPAETPAEPRQLVLVPATAAGDIPAALVPFARELGLMQQQLFDQFQQAMWMLFQMFHTVHQDQLKGIREELDRLRELTQEMQALQGELLRRSPPRPHAPAGADAPAVPDLGARSFPAAASGAGPEPSAGPQAQSPAAMEPSPPGPQPVTPPPGLSDEEIHTWLSQRLLLIQRERQTRWQRLLSLLTGKGSDEPAP